jgi:hypothetical protein
MKCAPLSRGGLLTHSLNRRAIFNRPLTRTQGTLLFVQSPSEQFRSDLKPETKIPPPYNAIPEIQNIHSGFQETVDRITRSADNWLVLVK